MTVKQQTESRQMMNREPYDRLVEDIEVLRERVWEMDIPHPTIPEYHAWHHKCSILLEHIDETLTKARKYGAPEPSTVSPWMEVTTTITADSPDTCTMYEKLAALYELLEAYKELSAPDSSEHIRYGIVLEFVSSMLKEGANDDQE